MRLSGILLPIFSLPSKHGIGTFGKEAFSFVDFLKESGQSYWQILPLGPTSFGDSPYQSFSAYAGNPYFIDLDLLCEQGLLKREDYEDIVWCTDEHLVNYELLYNNRLKVLHKAYLNLKENLPKDYSEIYNQNKFWLDDYALFMAIKDANNGASWDKWSDNLRFRREDAIEKAKKLYADKIDFYIALNYLFVKQWLALKTYANENGIKIIGDMPIYVAFDSADVWANPEQFVLDKSLMPKSVAGCPPDDFCEDGQLWGNPLYNWAKMKKEETPYSWWCKRISHSLKIYDLIRIDHFRGFEAYYSIPFGDKTAKNGVWKKGPGLHFFKCLKETFGQLPIIAEDLGTLTEGVYKLLHNTGFPGMKVLQFAFSTDEESEYLPHNHIKNCVVYTGTHDNDTLKGWEQTLDSETLAYVKKYLNINEGDDFNWSVIKAAFSSVADTVIIPLQDFCSVDSVGRINTPATLGDNWQWRVSSTYLNDWLSNLIYKTTKLYSRLPE
ncbi:MAG: 4-alpha-glucanotransferase [Ruminococcaceae bacterium]|nr:4-alpha-glucanotransferase [Oscillospiraceae bacterium]